ncbi:hypothetical protein FRB97_007178 [Tulasnella sp. 331]|nr:hypothetical protein FRB97_007178 [Tulasnella sp. 331]KAG8890457.1 hypothetical protein FRB98_008492 [Tulasnella sp. 332]
MSSILGFTHVDRFGEEDDEYEYEHETSYATLDLRNIDQNVLLNSTTFKLIGLNTQTPYLQLPGLTMRGEHDTLIGSEMIFSDGRDPTDRSRRFVVPLGTTSTRITFRPVEFHLRAAPQDGNAAAVITDDPPPVLFQGRKPTGKSVPKEKFLDSPGRGRGQRGRPRGRGRGGNTEAPKATPKPKGKGKQKANDDGDDDGDNGEDVPYGSSGDDAEIDYDAVDPNEDGMDESVAARPTTRPRRAAAVASSSKVQNLDEYAELDLRLLGGLDAMEVDDPEN